MNIALWIVQIILGLFFVMLGSMKAFQLKKAHDSGTSKGLEIFIGISEILGGLGLILPLATGIVPSLTSFAAIGLGVIMVLAAGHHAKKGEYKAISMPLIFLALLIFVIIGRW
ncbi:DoxX family protein [Paenibacillus sp. Marseille-Q4541]|uniref:DoxX family protein n=1 Tax=Paenibacillus sp. Marseille-Q4541 TaxID=2831522 RepID=UPI001BACA6D8|nr:DoxX family protein [Paenibacillus sp. Marseille-Q4541]